MLTAEGVARFFHLLFAFTWVGVLAVADWNARVARRNADWGHRALLWDICRRALGVAGLGALLGIGVLGNLLAPLAHWSMRGDSWLQMVNGLWVLSLAVLLLLAQPAARSLATISRAAAGGGHDTGYDAALGRYRLGLVLLSLLYVALLLAMVFRWKS